MSDELLQYRHFVSKQQFDKDLTDEQEEEVLAQFAALDPEKKGHIEWSDFLYYESLAVLRKLRTEVTPSNEVTTEKNHNNEIVYVWYSIQKDPQISFLLVIKLNHDLYGTERLTE